MIKLLRESFLPFKTNAQGKIFFRNVLLMLCILINVNIVRIVKDSYVTTMLGAETISFCKLLGELPFSILFFFVYSKLSNNMNTEKLCRYTIALFLIVLSVLPLFFFQFYDHVTLSTETIASISSAYPSLKWVVLIFGNWPYLIYLVIGEIWPVVAYSFLFWQFVNKFNDPKDSAKDYISYNLYGQTSMPLSGLVVSYFISNNTYLDQFVDSFMNPMNYNDSKVKVLSVIIMLLGLLAMALHYYCERLYRTGGEKLIVENKSKKSKDKFHLSIKETLSILIQSKQIRNIVLIIFGYGFTVTLMHLTWLSILQYKYPSPVDFMAFQARLNYWTGGLTIIIAIFGKKIIELFGLSFAAKLTPIMTLIPGVLFYLACMLFNYSMNTIVITYATLIGSIQYVLVRASKYVLFDSTKESLYTFMESEELKTKGKAIADVVGFKLGKAMGSLALAFPLMIFPSQNYISIAPFTLIALVIVCYFWISAVSGSVKGRV